MTNGAESEGNKGGIMDQINSSHPPGPVRSTEAENVGDGGGVMGEINASLPFAIGNGGGVMGEINASLPFAIPLHEELTSTGPMRVFPPNFHEVQMNRKNEIMGNETGIMYYINVPSSIELTSLEPEVQAGTEQPPILNGPENAPQTPSNHSNEHDLRIEINEPALSLNGQNAATAFSKYQAFAILPGILSLSGGLWDILATSKGKKTSTQKSVLNWTISFAFATLISSMILQVLLCRRQYTPNWDKLVRYVIGLTLVLFTCALSLHAASQVMMMNSEGVLNNEKEFGRIQI